jgi:UDP-GlcNAc:undecaprenyl-phosphate GlcNAc-1-phosphate transferase
MIVLFIVGACSLAASLALTPIFRDFFGFLEMVDQPDAPRKLHVRPIPRVGGIPVAISYIFVLAAVLFATSFWKEMLTESKPSLDLLGRSLPALVIIFVTGLLDDFRGLTPWQKLAGQVVAACWAFWAGVRLAPIAGYPLLDHWLGPLSVLWLVFCANAFNLIDGLDGLASGVALLAATGLLMAALIHHHPALALATVPLVGGLLGFLHYNFNPASIFLGDCGSLLIGFLLGCFGLMWNQGAVTGLGQFAPLMAMAVPTAEVAISVTRRFLRREPIFNADRNHIHHRLLSLGMTQRKATLILYGVSALAATLAVLQTIVQPRAATVMTVLFATGAYLGLRQLRYPEFSAMGRFLLGGDLRRSLRMRICLKEFGESLSRTRNVEECWDAVREVCSSAGFRHVALEVEDKMFQLTGEVSLPEQSRSMLIPMPGSGRILFVQDRRASDSAMWIAPIVEALEERLTLQRDVQETLTADKPVEHTKTLAAVG